MVFPPFNSTALEEPLLNRLQIWALFKIVVILEDNPRVREGQVYVIFLDHNKRYQSSESARDPITGAKNSNGNKSKLPAQVAF